MTRLRRFAIALLAAATVTVGSSATVQPASALPMSCDQAINVAQTLRTLADGFFVMGYYTLATAYYARARGILEAAC